MNTRAGGGGRKIRGVIIGIVTNIKDPEEIGRVKVRFPGSIGMSAPITQGRIAGPIPGGGGSTMPAADQTWTP